MKNFKIKNLKLSHVLDKITFGSKIKKEAMDMGHFDNCLTEDDIAKTAPMVWEMLQLPKYNTIKNKLKNACGVVNFVTNNEYEPLVELLIKSVYPPASNDIYGMGQPMGEKDYFVDASGFFGDTLDSYSGAELRMGYTKLDNIINGTQSIYSEEWFKNNLGVKNDNELKQTLGEDLAESIKQSMEEYNAVINQLNQVRDKINSLVEELETDERTMELDPQEKKNKKDQIKNLRGIYQQRKDAANAIILRNKTYAQHPFSGVKEREKDGFIHYNSLKDIQVVGEHLMRLILSNKPMANISGSVQNLIKKLNEYKTTNKKVIEARNNLLEFLKGDPEEASGRIRDALSVFTKLIDKFTVEANKCGKIMIIKNFETSLFCTPTPKEEGTKQGYQMGPLGSGIFEGFNSTIDANMIKGQDNRIGSKENRVILIISDTPIVALPSTTVIKMDVAPVDITEADIIVKHLLSPYSTRAKETAEYELNSRIEEKYLKNTSETNKKKNQEYNMASDIIASISGDLGTLDFDTMDQMQQLIVGLGQKDAVRTVRQALASGAKMVHNDKANIDILQLDNEEILGNLTGMVNESTSEGTRGFQVMTPHLDFDKYAYNKVSKWAKKVQFVGRLAREAARQKGIIKRYQSKMAEIDAKLSSGSKSVQGQKEDLALRKECENKLNSAMMERKTLATSLPHTYLLYGSPGVGKSVWAEALASILGFKRFVDVDLSGQKSKWVGETGQFMQRALDRMANSRKTVFLIDEIDRQLAMGGTEGGSDTSGAHETTKDQVKRLLDFFELTDNKRKMMENDIFVVITTNSIRDVDTALKSRIKDQYEVELPSEPEDYKKVITSFLEVEKAKFPNQPFYREDDDMSPKECWESIFKMFQQIDWDSVCNKLSHKKINYRKLIQILTESLESHKEWIISLRQMARGDEKSPSGLPFTTNNMVSVVDASSSSDAHGLDDDIGVMSVRIQKDQEIEKILKNNPLKTEDFVDEETGETRQRVIVSDEIMEVMNGSIATELDSPQWTVEEEEVVDDKTGEIKKRPIFVEKPPHEEMKEKAEETFVEDKIEEVKEKPSEQTKPLDQSKQKKDIINKEKKKETDKTNKIEEKGSDRILSSTDYLFKYLQKEGIISENGKINNMSKKTIDKKAQMAGINSGFTEGVYFFDTGLLVAPATDDVQPQTIQTELDKIKKE